MEGWAEPGNGAKVSCVFWERGRMLGEMVGQGGGGEGCVEETVIKACLCVCAAIDLVYVCFFNIVPNARDVMR